MANTENLEDVYLPPVSELSRLLTTAEEEYLEIQKHKADTLDPHLTLLVLRSNNEKLVFTLQMQLEKSLLDYDILMVNQNTNKNSRMITLYYLTLVYFVQKSFDSAIQTACLLKNDYVGPPEDESSNYPCNKLHQPSKNCQNSLASPTPTKTTKDSGNKCKNSQCSDLVNINQKINEILEYNKANNDLINKSLADTNQKLFELLTKIHTQPDNPKIPLTNNQKAINLLYQKCKNECYSKSLSQFLRWILSFWFVVIVSAVLYSKYQNNEINLLI